MAKGYSFGALTDVVYPVYSGALTGNLNDYWGSDKRGIWYQNANAGATLALNYPTTQAGVLEVIPHNANFTGASMQRYTVYSSNYVFIRSQDSSNRAWNAWRVQLNDLNLYNIIYPVGIGVWFSTAINPNNVFSGTTWVQNVNGRSVRMATSLGTNAATAGNIGNYGGADTVTLSAANLPAHAHSMAHTHTINHTHNGVNTANSAGAHTHTTSGTAASNGAHTHTVSGTAANAGAHQHTMENIMLGRSNSRAVSGGSSGVWGNQDTTSSGAHTHTISGTAASAGAHTHTVSGTAASNGAHTHTVTIPAYYGDSGASSAANTGSVGNGAAFSTTGVYVYQAYWIRTA